MTNCIHPIIVRKTLSYDFNQNEYVKERFRGLQANTSALSPDELDGSAVLMGDGPEKLAEEIVNLQQMMDIT